MSVEAERRIARMQEDLARGEEIINEINAEADALEMWIDYASIPAAPRRKTKVSAMCGCDRQMKVEVSLIDLERLSGIQAERGFAGKPFCGRCHSQVTRVEFEKIVRKKGGNVMTPMTSLENPVFIKCGNPLHPQFKAWPGNILYSEGWCKQCNFEDRKDSKAQKYAEIAATFGHRLETYQDKGVCGFINNHGNFYESRPSNFPRSRGIKLDENKVRLALDGNRGFIFMGSQEQLLPNLPEVLQYHLLNSDIHTLSIIGQETLPSKKHTVELMESMTKAFTEKKVTRQFGGLPEITEPLELYNIWRNPQWQLPGVYTWGEIDPFTEEWRT